MYRYITSHSICIILQLAFFKKFTSLKYNNHTPSNFFSFLFLTIIVLLQQKEYKLEPAKGKDTQGTVLNEKLCASSGMCYPPGRRLSTKEAHLGLWCRALLGLSHILPMWLTFVPQEFPQEFSRLELIRLFQSPHCKSH